MTFPITESIIKSADDLISANNFILIVPVLIFIAVSIISGILTYKIKTKNLKKNQTEKENADKIGRAHV